MTPVESQKLRPKTPSESQKLRPKTPSELQKLRPKTPSEPQKLRPKTPSELQKLRPKTPSESQKLRLRPKTWICFNSKLKSTTVYFLQPKIICFRRSDSSLKTLNKIVYFLFGLAYTFTLFGLNFNAPD